MNDELAARLIKAGGVLESGAVANMRTYLLPVEARTHTRILGEERTLCGIPLWNRNPRGEQEWAWQFYNRGRWGDRVPSGAETGARSACKRCARHEVLRHTQAVADARHESLRRTGRPGVNAILGGSTDVTPRRRR